MLVFPSRVRALLSVTKKNADTLPYLLDFNGGDEGARTLDLSIANPKIGDKSVSRVYLRKYLFEKPQVRGLLLPFIVV